MFFYLPAISVILSKKIDEVANGEYKAASLSTGPLKQ